MSIGENTLNTILRVDPRSRQRSMSHGSSDHKISGFKMREMQHSGPRPPELVQLEEMFGASVQYRMIGQVYDQLQPDMAACVDALINVAEENKLSSAEVANCSTPGAQAVDPVAFPGLHGVGGRQSPPEGNLWESLPPDCQVLITNKLNVKDLAIASLVCTSMARTAATILGRVDVVRCRCSIRSVSGMLRCHRNASQVSTPTALLQGFTAAE